ncbi:MULTISPECIES: hypothetical protein [unclassified Chelatococcus]|uniref:hypothetical protein n=1 Tax=unclassified Chelatococcus TaxID=2638111 RepID=UPI001BCFCA4B|nr:MULTISPECIES: hypothetical protein [unclassified Chelatococcus]MBS7737803.1 hypothetical protein [Chelatococcus sp. HY11]MCO5079259.1 hypothetical protein [Chelatococcus sp.]CAH1665979.1 hypothetical protein CHELA41_22754 [Hyphomicrobiales bacterium]CAH1680980.1 hypothetical protein CHELA20_52166 [Hyphomicrobiales bacterium]
MSRAAFYSAVRKRPFGGALVQSQVDGMETILDAWAALAISDDRRWLAYMLATTYHETAATMQPIRERGGAAYFTRMYDIRGERPRVATELGNTRPGDGALFHGRGYVQLTGRRNYARASDVVQHDLVADPDAAMRPDFATAIMFAGMRDGWFTGKRLADYFSRTKDDPANARRIINGTDKAQLIAGYHRDFLAAFGNG